MKYYIYILECKDSKSLYVSYTLDLKRTLQLHMDGLNPHTKNRLPVALVWVALRYSKSEAIAFFDELKNLSHLKLKQFLYYSDTTTNGISKAYVTS